MLSWNGSLAPGHRRDADGVLHIGGVAASSLAAAYGSPLLAMDAAVVEASLERFRAICDPNGIGISYAAKAFICTAFARMLARSGIGVDVCSLGELEIAESAAYDAARLSMHGAGKTDAELRAALDGRVGRVILDGLSDLRRLASMAAEGGRARVVLRLNTGVETGTHPHVTTVGDEAKFGFVRDEEPAAIEILLANPALEFAGLHGHAGSQITQPKVFVENLSELLKASRRFAQRGLRSRVLIAGGGFGVQSDPQRPQDEMDIAATVAACSAFLAADGGYATPALEFEPGRSIVAHAGTTIYEVLSVKRRPEGNAVIVDGGMADNPRPMLYGAYHHIVTVVERGAPQCLTNVFGRACESDYIGQASLPEDLDRGDLLAVCTTGAYTYSMASNYNAFPTPAVVAVRDGEHERWLDRRGAPF